MSSSYGLPACVYAAVWPCGHGRAAVALCINYKHVPTVSSPRLDVQIIEASVLHVLRLLCSSRRSL